MKNVTLIFVLLAGLIMGCGSDSGREKGEDKEDISMVESCGAQAGFADINGAKIYYEICGTGTPLVMLHAGIADCRMWQPQFEFFSQYHKVVTYDLRGFGKTGMPEGAYAHYRDLAGLLDTLGLDSVILMGCSLGGSAAIDFALEYPARVLGLVLVGSSVDGYQIADEQTRKNWMEIAEALRKNDYETAADLEINYWIAGAGRSPAELDSSIMTLARDMLLTYYRNDPDKGEEEGPEELGIDRLAQIKAPTLILVGDLDAPDIMHIADLLARQIAGSRKIIIPETAHLPNLEKPEAFNALVHQFLRDKGL